MATQKFMRCFFLQEISNFCFQKVFGPRWEVKMKNNISCFDCKIFWIKRDSMRFKLCVDNTTSDHSCLSWNSLLEKQANETVGEKRNQGFNHKPDREIWIWTPANCCNLNKFLLTCLWIHVISAHIYFGNIRLIKKQFAAKGSFNLLSLSFGFNNSLRAVM